MSTLAVDALVHQRLHHLKQAWGLATYNEVLRRLLDAAGRTPDSLFGKGPKLGRLEREARNEMWGD